MSASPPSSPPAPLVPLADLERRLRGVSLVVRSGRVTEATQTALRALVPDARVGERCRIRRPPAEDLLAEVIGLDGAHSVLAPLGPIDRVAARAPVIPEEGPACVPCGTAVVGRVLDALGRPLDQVGQVHARRYAALTSATLNPMARSRIKDPLATGVKVIDGLLTLGWGHSVAVVAPPETHATPLLTMIARHAGADLVVYALIGERGGAVRGILEDQIGPQALGRACVIVSTSDQTPMLRVQSARAAAAIAEAARSEGQRVLLVLDSLTRLSQALRDVAVAAGQHAAPDGFPASVLTDLSAFCERAGNDGKGSITCLFSLQLSPANHRDEGLTHEVLAFVDATLRLSPSLIARGHAPPIDILASHSKAMPMVASAEHLATARQVLELIADAERESDVLSLAPNRGQPAYRGDPRQMYSRVIEPFLRQPNEEGHDFAKTIANLRLLLN